MQFAMRIPISLQFRQTLLSFFLFALIFFSLFQDQRNSTIKFRYLYSSRVFTVEIKKKFATQAHKVSGLNANFIHVIRSARFKFFLQLCVFTISLVIWWNEVKLYAVSWIVNKAFKPKIKTINQLGQNELKKKINHYSAAHT